METRFLVHIYYNGTGFWCISRTNMTTPRIRTALCQFNWDVLFKIKISSYSDALLWKSFWKKDNKRRQPNRQILLYPSENESEKYKCEQT